MHCFIDPLNSNEHMQSSLKYAVFRLLKIIDIIAVPCILCIHDTAFQAYADRRCL